MFLFNTNHYNHRHHFYNPNTTCIIIVGYIYLYCCFIHLSCKRCFWHECPKAYISQVQAGADDDEKKIIHRPVLSAFTEMRLHTESRTEALEVIDACVQHIKLYPRAITPGRCQRGLLFVAGIRDDVPTTCAKYCCLGNRLFGGGTQSRLGGENADLIKELPEIQFTLRPGYLMPAVQANTLGA
jgi:hypothetical protein